MFWPFLLAAALLAGRWLWVSAYAKGQTVTAADAKVAIDTDALVIAALKAANDEKDAHIRTVHRLVAEERSSWALFYMPDNESADAKYWRVH